MTGEKFDWIGVFKAIEAAMISAANQHSAEFAGLEAERQGLVNQGDANETYQDKIWEKAADGVILCLRRHCYDQSHAYKTLPDMNVLSLELRQGDSILQRSEHRFED